MTELEEFIEEFDCWCAPYDEAVNMLLRRELLRQVRINHIRKYQEKKRLDKQAGL